MPTRYACTNVQSRNACGATALLVALVLAWTALAASGCETTQELGTGAGDAGPDAAPVVHTPSTDAQTPSPARHDAGPAVASNDAGPSCDDDGDRVLAAGCADTRGDAFPGVDCDDHDVTVHPEAPEACNHRDDDCDGKIDETTDCDIGAELDMAALGYGFRSVAVDAHDNVYAAGIHLASDPASFSGVVIPPQDEILLASYDAKHALRWVQTIGAEPDYQGPKLAVRGDTLFVLGEATPSFDASVQGKAMTVVGWFLLALSTTDGEVQWLTPIETQVPPDHWNGDSNGYAIALGADGDIYVAMTDSSVPNVLVATYGRFAPDGTQRWLRSVNGTDDTQKSLLQGIAVSPHDYVYLCGQTWNNVDIGGCAISGTDAAGQYFVIALDGDGKCRWERDVALDKYTSLCSAIAAGPEDQVAMAGQISEDLTWLGHKLLGDGNGPVSPWHTNIAAVEIDKDGNYVWDWQYISREQNSATSVIIDDDSRVFLGVQLGRESENDSRDTAIDEPLGMVIGLDAHGTQRFMRDVPPPPLGAVWNYHMALTSTGDAVVASHSLAYLATGDVKD